MNFILDVEADGPAPGVGSMVEIGLVKLDRNLKTTFHAKMRPIYKIWDPNALIAINKTRDEVETYGDPKKAMQDLHKWILEVNGKGYPRVWSDNPAFDWQWLNFYMWKYTECNPFGFSARDINALYGGIHKNMYKSKDFKKLRKTKHDHNPVNDAIGNAEALLTMIDKYNLKGFNM